MLQINSFFSLGQIVATATALEQLSMDDMYAALRRHARRDWGDVCSDDQAANDEAVINEGRILSVYHGGDGVRFWIITEWDRSITTILLPSDY
ncbi:MAG TPA: hypothetical protein VGL56_18390 [Fimbriimonadaceae bacterium]|jgi:hypothetical protein